jgi:uncharacterized membrane protein HdeD (DUF308 family)
MAFTTLPPTTTTAASQAAQTVLADSVGLGFVTPPPIHAATGEGLNASLTPPSGTTGVELTTQSCWFIGLEGVVCILLGAMALVLPALSLFSLDLLMGAVFLAQACTQILRFFQTQGMPGFLVGLMSAATTLILGLTVFVYPDDWVSIRLIVILYLATQALSAGAMSHRLQLAAYTGGFRFLKWVSWASVVLVCLGWGQHQGWQLALLAGAVLMITGFLNLAISMRPLLMPPMQASRTVARAIDPLATTPLPLVEPPPAVVGKPWWQQGKQRRKVAALMATYQTVAQVAESERWRDTFVHPNRSLIP